MEQPERGGAPVRSCGGNLSGTDQPGTAGEDVVGPEAGAQGAVDEQVLGCGG